MFDRRIDERISAITRRQHGVIARRQLLAAGLSAGGIASRLRYGRLFPVIRGVHSPSPHVDTWGRRYAAVLAAGGDPLDDERADLVVLSHWSAAQVHDLITRQPGRHEVTSVGTGTRRQAAVRIHRARALSPEDVVRVHGLPVTGPARTILDIAVQASATRVRQLIREAEYRRLVTAGSIAAVVERNWAHAGARLVRRVDPRTAEAALLQTPIEDRMRTVLDRLPLNAPISQHPVTGASGRPYRADFAWPDLRLIVETDGRASHDRSTSFQSDRERDADLAAVGWLTLRFTWLQLNDPERVAATILATARVRAPD